MDETERRVCEWIAAGQRATMMITSAMHHPVMDDTYLRETTQILSEMTACEMALTMTWLARQASDAMASAHGGSYDAAASELQATGLALVEARSSVLGHFER